MRAKPRRQTQHNRSHVCAYLRHRRMHRPSLSPWVVTVFYTALEKTGLAQALLDVMQTGCGQNRGDRLSTIGPTCAHTYDTVVCTDLHFHPGRPLFSTQQQYSTKRVANGHRLRQRGHARDTRTHVWLWTKSRYLRRMSWCGHVLDVVPPKKLLVTVHPSVS